jgi:hypothetical protein
MYILVAPRFADGFKYDLTTLTDLRFATVFTYVQTVFINDCKTNPGTLIESRTLIYKQISYPNSPVTTVYSQQNTTTSLTFSYSNLLVTSFAPGDDVIMVIKYYSSALTGLRAGKSRLPRTEVQPSPTLYTKRIFSFFMEF